MPRFLSVIFASRIAWGLAFASMLAGMVWLFGGMLTLHGTHPLADTRARLLLIGTIYAVWTLVFLCVKAWCFWRTRTTAAAADGEVQLPHRKLKKSFEEATKLLRRAHAGSAPWYAPRRWWPRLSRDYLYHRPWYLLVSAPGAGKTTMLARSGLHFPFADLFGQTTRHEVGATLGCDWWLTDAAVLLDTAGFPAAGHDAQDGTTENWPGLLNLLRKYRPRQPIDGVLLAINMDDLLDASAEARHEQARLLHKRLQELRIHLRVRFPVYVMVTKSDRLAGFLPYFSGLDEDRRQQIWGFTFPYEATQAAGFDLTASVEKQHDMLLRRLEAGLAETMIAIRDVEARAHAYLLPQQFARLKSLLPGYLDTVFSSSSFEIRLVPRGVYFTSAVANGGDDGAAASEATLPQHSAPDPLGNHPEAKKDASDTYFIRDLLEKVVFPEAGLAESNRWWEYRNSMLHWSGYALLGALLVLAGTFWYASYRNNHAYLDEVARKLPAVEAQGNELDPLRQRDLFRLLPYLDALRHLSQSQQFATDSPPLRYGFGLYQGKQLEATASGLYQRALDTLLLPLAAAQIRDILANDSRTDPVFSHEALKAYRMMLDPGHYDAGFLRAWLMSNLRRQHAADVTQAQWDSLDAHLEQLLGQKTFSSPFARDTQLEEQTLAYLGTIPASRRLYRRLRQKLLGANERRSVSLIDLAGAQAELVFRRSDGKSLVDSIPGLYTRDGYWQTFDKQLASLAGEMSEEDAWVLGTTGRQTNPDDVVKAVRQLYMQDFMSYWDGLLDSVALNDISSLSQRIEIARLLSGPDSPLRRLVVNAAKNLQLTRDKGNNAAPKGAVDGAQTPSNKLESQFSDADAGPDDVPGQPEQVVVNHYRSLIDLAQSSGEPGGGIEFDKVLKQINDLYNYLLTVQSAASSGMNAPASDVVARLQTEFDRLPFRQMLRSLVVGAGNDVQSSEIVNVRKHADADVMAFCRRAIAGRYPLVRNASQDITAEDFGRMFAPGSGLMDSFFQQNLMGKVDTSGTAWRFNRGIGGDALSGGENVLRPFQQAQNIRDTFFGRDDQRTPSFRVTLRPSGMDGDIQSMSLDVNGQTMQYSHGPLVSQVVNWPGTKDNQRVDLQLNLFDGSSASLSASGDWALHHLFDNATIAAGKNARSHFATFNIEGHRVTLEVISNSIRDPFLPPPFTCS